MQRQRHPHAGRVNRAPEQQEDPVISRHDPPPGRAVPPDMLLAKPADAEGGVQHEPQKILDDEKYDDRPDDLEFSRPRPRREEQRERKMRHEKNENLQPEMIAGERA